MPLELALGLSPDHPLMRIIQGLLICCTALMPGLFGYQTFLIAQKERQRRRRENPPNPWKMRWTRIVYENAWLRLREDAVTVRMARRESMAWSNSALGGSRRPQCRREIVLVGQWRYPLGRYSWEIPRGGSQPGESDLLAVARRECGKRPVSKARHWQAGARQSISTTESPRMSSTCFWLRASTAAKRSPDPEEEIAIRWIPFRSRGEMAAERRNHAKSAAWRPSCMAARAVS